MRRALLIAALGLLSVLGLAEWILRWSLPGFHTAALPAEMIRQHSEVAGFRYDPDLMWTWAHLPSPAAGLNEFGFRRLEPMTQTKPEGVTRVIVFGDSQTYGGGVQTEEAFPAQAERQLGAGWEVLNAGTSGYRSLNIYRLMRLKMMAYEPDIFVVNCMLNDSPAEDGELHQASEGALSVKLREALWNSRLNYLFQMGLRASGLGIWEDLPWPVHLQKVREISGGRFSNGAGNHEAIGRWAQQQGVQVVFMEYPYQTPDHRYGCHAPAAELPQGYPVLETCSVLADSGLAPREVFIDSNHPTPEGNQVIGAALAEVLRPLAEGQP